MLKQYLKSENLLLMNDYKYLQSFKIFITLNLVILNYFKLPI